MANKWAIANGNWSDGSTWNDGVVPTADDDVWANGYTIRIDIANIEVKSLRNTSSENISQGGYFQQYLPTSPVQTLVISADCYASGNDLLWMRNLSGYGYGNLVVNGNIQNAQGAALISNNVGATQSFTINGNIVGRLFNMVNHVNYQAWTFTINGNVDLNSDCLFYSYSGDIGKITINGTLKQKGRIIENDNDNRTNTLIINGELQCYDSFVYQYDYEMNGSINTQNASNPYLLPIKNGKKLTTTTGITYITPSDYPAESNVKLGVKYGYDNYEGQYTAVADYPQEANVLKGVEYDDGNKVGTLEVIALSGATATAENISVVNLTEQQINRVKNCATVSTVQKCFEDFKE